MTGSGDPLADLYRQRRHTTEALLHSLAARHHAESTANDPDDTFTHEATEALAELRGAVKAYRAAYGIETSVALLMIRHQRAAEDLAHLLAEQ